MHASARRTQPVQSGATRFRHYCRMHSHVAITMYMDMRMHVSMYMCPVRSDILAAYLRRVGFEVIVDDSAEQVGVTCAIVAARYLVDSVKAKDIFAASLARAVSISHALRVLTLRVLTSRLHSLRLTPRASTPHATTPRACTSCSFTPCAPGGEAMAPDGQQQLVALHRGRDAGTCAVRGRNGVPSGMRGALGSMITTSISLID